MAGTLYFTAGDGSHGPELWKLAPSATGGTLSGTEGQRLPGVVATFTDTDVTAGAAYTATITWGDGHNSTGTVRAAGSGTYTVSGANTYAEAGNYTVSVKVTRAGGPVLTTTATAKVAEAPLGAAATNARAIKGQTVSLALGTLRDANPSAVAADFTVLINWGDGQTSSGTLTPHGAGRFNVAGSHKYTQTGNFTAVVTVTERGGQAVTIKPVIQVTT